MRRFGNLKLSGRPLVPFGFELGIRFTSVASAPPKPAALRPLVFLGCDASTSAEEWAFSGPGHLARTVLWTLLVGNLVWLAGQMVLTGHF